MGSMKILHLFFIFSFSCSSFAFLPPLGVLVKDVFESRNKTGRTLYTFTHKLRGTQDSYELEEQVMEEKGKFFILFKVNGILISGSLDSQNYQFGKDKNVPARSSLFLNYYATTNDDSFLSLVFQEEFARRDQSYQLKPTAPVTAWNLKDQYLRHDDIFLVRLPLGVSIAVQAALEGESRKTIYFDRLKKQISRLEWKEGLNKYYWDFGPATRFSYGNLPRQARFFKNDEEWFVTEFQGIKNLNEKAFADWKNLWKNNFNKFNPDAFAYLKQFVTYR